MSTHTTPAIRPKCITARHARVIITPARIGGRIGQNHKAVDRVERYRCLIWLATIATSAAVMGLIAAAILQH